MNTNQILFLLGLTFHRVTCDKEKTSNAHSLPSATSVESAPPSQDDSAHIPYHLEQSHSFQELLSWHDPEAVGWITRKNTLFESILRHGLEHDPALLAYFLAAENSGFFHKNHNIDIGSGGKKNEHPVVVPGDGGPSQATSEGRRKWPYFPGERPLPFPQCMGVGPPIAKERERRIQTHVRPPNLETDCHYVDGDILYPRYLVCSSEEITTMPTLPALELDLFELNSTKVECVPSFAFLNVQVKGVRLIRNAIENVNPRAFEGILGTTVVQITHNKLKWIWFDDCFVGLDKVTSLQLDFNEITFQGFNDLYSEKEAAETVSVLPNLIVLSLRKNPLRYIPKTLFAPLTNSKVSFLVLENCQLKEIHPGKIH